jgi:hypothetical protein
MRLYDIFCRRTASSTAPKCPVFLELCRLYAGPTEALRYEGQCTSDREIGRLDHPIQATPTSSRTAGKKTENTVPLRRPSMRLRTWMVPPCFFTIPEDTHRPRPVPVSFFVL